MLSSLLYIVSPKNIIIKFHDCINIQENDDGDFSKYEDDHVHGLENYM